MENMKTQINKQAQKWLIHREKAYTKTFDKEGMIPMQLGECAFPIKALDNLFRKAGFSVARKYPTQIREVKKKLARLFLVKENMITLGNGSDEIIENIPRIFLNPGDRVLVVTPTFFRFVDASEKVGAKVFIIKTRSEDNFRISEKIVEKIIKAAREKKIKLIWLCSPNNPTGIPIEQLHIEIIASKIDAIIVLDQIYADLQENVFTQPKDLIKKFPRTIILKSFSKVFGLAGLRVGFAISNNNIAQKLEKWRIPFNISSFSLEIINELLNGQIDIPTQMKGLVKKEREFVVTHIKKLKNIKLISGSETNLLLLKHETKDLFQELQKRNIFVADFNNAKGIEGEEFIRVNVGARKQNTQFINALIDIFQTPPQDSERTIPSENLYERRKKI